MDHALWKLTLLLAIMSSAYAGFDPSIVHYLRTRQISDRDLLRSYPNGAFDDRNPHTDPYNQQYKDYVNELIRFDDWATGHSHVRGPQDVLPDDEFNDPHPQVDPNNQQYKNYVNELIRFDDWATGHGHVRGPQDVLPDDEFNDPKPVIPPNQAYNDYVKELTRFDAWVTGQKVPIPADPLTDAQHQDIGTSDEDDTSKLNVHPSQASLPEDEVVPFTDKPGPQPASSKIQQTVVPFNDQSPSHSPNQAYKDYVNELTRFDGYVTGDYVHIPADTKTDALHQVFRRSTISPDEHFGESISDSTPANPANNPDYNSFVGELKRFDPWVTGHKVDIPHDPATDALHQITRRSLGSRR
ncbi:uncharacterized protein LOC129757237 [Uranotaenia lowii]|uniref:uncharacterized protein LOC129757237 n=1 Tax=Uranotaenia lowii TaxID=190385 RepID=UPI002479D755|nr:uncharacterized protein LOC129757237 [Uranotaenia lowii]